MRLIFKSICVLGCMVSGVAAANSAPIVDLTSNQHTMLAANRATSAAEPMQAGSAGYQATMPMVPLSMTMEQRVVRLEQQVTNLTKMNLPQQISDLQQQVQQLNGQLQVQAHDLKMLNKQQSSFYKDLDQRITQISNLSNGGSSVTTGGNQTGGAGLSNSPGQNGSAAGTTTQPSGVKSVGSNSSSALQTKMNMAVSSTKAADAHAYQAAFKLLAAKQFDASIAAFKRYIDHFPNGRYIANAHYWLGDMYLQQHKVQLAKNEFHTVISQFAYSNKVADATLKLGMVAKQMGEMAKAKQYFRRVKVRYPGSTAAQLSSVYLQQLRQSTSGNA